MSYVGYEEIKSGLARYEELKKENSLMKNTVLTLNAMNRQEAIVALEMMLEQVKAMYTDDGTPVHERIIMLRPEEPVEEDKTCE